MLIYPLPFFAIVLGVEAQIELFSGRFRIKLTLAGASNGAPRIVGAFQDKLIRQLCEIDVVKAIP